MEALRWFPRRFSGLVGLVALVVVVSCAPAAAPSPTSAPAKPAPTTAPAKAAPTAAPAQKPADTAAGSTAKAISLPKPELTSLRIGHSTLEASSMTYAFARDMGLFKKYGIENVELFYNEGDAKAVQALIAGAVDASAQGVSVTISSQLTDTPLLTPAMTVTTLTDDLVAVADVKSAADLRGKRVAVSAFGGTSHGSVLLALKGLGLTSQDVTITQIGGESARIAALQAGSVAAAPIDISRRAEMQQLGFNILISLPDTPLDYGRNGLVLRRDFVEKNPNTTLAMVAALLEAQQLLFTETEKAIDSFAKWAQISDRSQAETQVKTILPYMRRDMRWSKEGFELAREVLASQNPAIAEVDVTKAYTFEFLDKLKEMGFNQAVGVPGS